MRIIVRILSTLLLIAFCGFCVFGFLASFEPLPPLRRWLGVAAYSIFGVASLWTLSWLWWPRRMG